MPRKNAAQTSSVRQRARPPPALPAVLIVHGAWLDGGSWSDVISRLNALGLRAITVPVNMVSLREDAALLARVIAVQPQPVVLVGHAWGGAVITDAGGGENVRALVYVAAFAPDRYESGHDLLQRPGNSGLEQALEIDCEGWLWIRHERYGALLAQDLPAAHGQVLAATQRPIRATALSETTAATAWLCKPSWYLVAEQDRLVLPARQVEMAHRMRASIIRVAGSHVVYISQPRATVGAVLAAIGRPVTRTT